MRNRLFGRKSEQTIEPNTPQLALFNEPESEPMPLVCDADEEADTLGRSGAHIRAANVVKPFSTVRPSSETVTGAQREKIAALTNVAM